MTTQQPEALRLADWLQAAVQIFPQRSEDDPGGYVSEVDQIMDEAAAKIRSQHARITELEAQLSAIGAGGVSPLIAGADRWVIVDVRLPEPNVEVLCAGQGWCEPFVTAGYYDDERREWYRINTHWTDATGGAQYQTTHWQPLPAAPSIAGESNG